MPKLSGSVFLHLGHLKIEIMYSTIFTTKTIVTFQVPPHGSIWGAFFLSSRKPIFCFTFSLVKFFKIDHTTSRNIRQIQLKTLVPRIRISHLWNLLNKINIFVSPGRQCKICSVTPFQVDMKVHFSNRTVPYCIISCLFKNWNYQLK